MWYYYTVWNLFLNLRLFPHECFSQYFYCSWNALPNCFMRGLCEWLSSKCVTRDVYFLILDSSLESLSSARWKSEQKWCHPWTVVWPQSRVEGKWGVRGVRFDLSSKTLLAGDRICKGRGEAKRVLGRSRCGWAGGRNPDPAKPIRQEGKIVRETQMGAPSRLCPSQSLQRICLWKPYSGAFYLFIF